MEDAVELWRRCENAWATWLGQSVAVVMRLTDATSNTAHSGAPLMQVGDRHRRAPDLLAMRRDGMSEYWEVKTRTRADVDGHTGQRRHWMPFDAYDDYLAVSEHTGVPVQVVLYEAASATVPGRWLRIDVEHLRQVGTLEERWVAQGRRVRAWMWPVAEMTAVDGPEVDESVEPELAPSAGGEAPVPRSDLEPVERELRRRRVRAADSSRDRAETPAPPSRLHEWLDSEPVAALDVLRRRLGIPTLPRYSVLRVGLDGVDVEDLMGLLHYGIRVFVVADQTLTSSMPEAEARAFRGARLLETAVVRSTTGLGEWVVDGTFATGAEKRLTTVLAEADDSGQLNVSQYRVVHAPGGADVMVQAGAGTGKTETMSERIVFLLATGAGSEGDGQLGDLRADEIGLVTFTREAAAEMRSRVGRSLLLRQRLCHRCAQPALAWMLQLAGADIATIHSLARRVAASSAGVLGLGPDFRVGRLTTEFRSATQRRLTDDLTRLVDRFPGKVPAAYEWQRHVTTLWEALENNGVDLMRLADDPRGSVALDWGGLPGDGLEAERGHGHPAAVRAAGRRHARIVPRPAGATDQPAGAERDGRAEGPDPSAGQALQVPVRRRVPGHRPGADGPVPRAEPGAGPPSFRGRRRQAGHLPVPRRVGQRLRGAAPPLAERLAAAHGVPAQPELPVGQGPARLRSPPLQQLGSQRLAAVRRSQPP